MNFIFIAVYHITVQLIVLILPGLVLTGLMNLVSKRFETIAVKGFDHKLFLLFFGWLGTAVHEFSHLFMCVVFGHKVNDFKLFILNPKDNVMGYVKHRYNPESFYQSAGNLFIGIAPILGGSLVILLSAQIFLPDIISIPDLNMNSSEGFLGNLLQISIVFVFALISPENFYNPEYYLFLYIAFCVGSSMKLSRADFKGAKKGLIIVICFIFLINLIAAIIGPVWINNFSNIVMHISVKLFFIYNLILIVLFMNLFFICLLKIILKKF